MKQAHICLDETLGVRYAILPGDRPTCNSVTDAELGQVMRLPNISPGTTWM